VVEVHNAGTVEQRLVPVEYKRGKAKAHDADRIQLAAQALCLEEMCGTSVPEGALFYGTPKRRERVAIDQDLRAATEAAAVACRTMINAGARPPPEPGTKCRRCSLLQMCAPHGKNAVAAWFARQRALLEADP
jgi:CRISPR-associated exonuclease Cas4